MTVLVTADWHLTEHPRDRYRFRALEFIADLIKRHKVDDLVILGDLTHNKNHHPDTLVNDIANLLYRLSNLCELFILQGNHDYIEAHTPFFHFLRFFDAVCWVREPEFIELVSTTFEHVCFLPHTRDYKKDWNGIRKLWNKADLIFAHNAFEGAISESGKRLTGIPLDIFPADVPIISGDIHTPQTIEQLTYVGAPYTQKYGDDYDPRVLLIQNGGEMESIPVPGPQKVLLEVSSLEDLDEAVLDCGKDDMIRVRYHLRNEQLTEWPKMLAAIEKSIPGVIVQPIVEQQEVRLQGQVRKSDRELVRDYGAQQKFSQDVMNVGYEVIDEH